MMFKWKKAAQLHWLPMGLMSALLALSGALAGSPSDLGQQQRGSWPGPEGKPLPFETHSQALDFLQGAEAVSAGEISSGTNNTLRLLLKQGDREVHAVFREVDIEIRRTAQVNGRFILGFRDSCVFEVAAYKLSRLLGIDQVPPTALRKYKDRPGSVQLWIYGAFSETERRKRQINPPDDRHWTQQVQTKLLFDRLINNMDRNLGNQLIDRNWKLWLIDHTRTFRPSGKLRSPRSVYWCSENVYKALKTLDRAEVEKELEGLLRGDEISALFARWDKMVEHLDRLIEKRGREKVLF